MKYFLVVLAMLCLPMAAHAQMVNAQTGTSYTFQPGDCDPSGAKLVTFSNAAAVAVTLPQAGVDGRFLGGCTINAQNLGAGLVTITPTISTINGSATMPLSQYSSAQIRNDSSPSATGNYFVSGGPYPGGGTFPNGFTVTGAVYYARNPQYGACTWSTAVGADVGPCINAAITAAATAGGGTVVLPAGNFNVATQVINGTSGVHIAGAGVGFFRDSSAPSNFVSITQLTWTGAAGATMFIATPGGTQTLYSAGVTGVVFNCASLANICAEFEAVSTSTIDVGVSEPVTVGFLMTTKPSTFTDGPGSQYNDVWVQARSTSATNSPTGILIDGAVGSNYNSSLNHFHFLSAWFAKGDGIVFGYSDNNTIDQIIAYQDPTNKGGTPLVWANTGYIQKNGIGVAGAATSTRLLKSEVSAIICGLWCGSTITQGVHTGTAAVTTYSLVTNSGTTQQGSTLNFASTGSNALVGETLSCSPSWACGVAPGSPISAVTSTTLVMAAQAPNGVANGATITISYGITKYAAVGTYVMTAVDGTHWSLTTVPAGGHAQTNVLVAGGAISFTDMVIPLSGTPNASDTFTIVVPAIPSSNITMESLDKGNGVADPLIEPGAGGFVSRTNAPFPSNFTSTLFTPTTPVLTGTIPVTASEVRIVQYGQGGCGGGGLAVAAGASVSGGGGGGGGGVKDTGWFPASNVSGTYTISFGTQCTAAAAGASGSVGGNAVFSMSGFPTTTAYGGGGGSVGISAGASGGGGGAGTIAVGGSSTTGTGATGGNFGGGNGGSGVSGANNATAMGSGGGGGGTNVGVAGAEGFSEFGGAEGAASGGGCNAGTGATGTNGHSPITLTNVTASGTKGVSGNPGVAAGLTGSGIGVGGGSGASGAGNDGTSSVAGNGGAGGAGGGAGAGGGSACGTTSVGGSGGAGGAAQVLVLTR